MNYKKSTNIKLCKKEQEINPDTDRCRKKCNKDQERNHEKKGICRNKCNIEQERNPDTGRCKKQSPKKQSPKKQSPKRQSPKRQSPKRQSPKRQSPKRQSPKRQLEESKKFVDLCEKFIMTDKLDHVYASTWLKNGDYNIFLIGEEHKPHDNLKCIGILDMFRKLIEKNPKNDMNIDFFIEIYNRYVYNDDLYNFKYDIINKAQIYNIRIAFLNCIKSKKCPYIRVHWTDPSIISEKDKNYKKLPKWLKLLQEYSGEGFSIKNDNDFKKWKKNKKILKYFNPYINENDILKLLTENIIVIKEFNKVFLLYPMFNIEKIKSIFLEIYFITKKMYKNNYDYTIFSMDRTVMDFYSVARILKSQMKNVIFYAGNNHIERIIFILNTYFGFYIKNKILGTCFDNTNPVIWYTEE